MPAIPGNVIIMLPEEPYYAHTMLNYVMGFNFLPKGQARGCELNMAAACNA